MNKGHLVFLFFAAKIITNLGACARNMKFVAMIHTFTSNFSMKYEVSFLPLEKINTLVEVKVRRMVNSGQFQYRFVLQE